MIDLHPRLLLLDLTKIGGSAATGQLKQAIFGGWPDGFLLHLHGGGLSNVELNGGRALPANGKLSLEHPRIVESCLDFDPDVILYRPVADNPAFHKKAMEIIGSSAAPLALWLMDDWPERLRADNEKLYALFENDLEWLFACSSANFAISNGMAEAFGERYGVSFGVIHNGVNPSDWPDRVRGRDHSIVTIRYSGSLAPDTTRHSVLEVARAVSALASKGVAVQFEAQTQQVWFDRYAALFHNLSGVSLRVAKLSPAAYRQWLCDADSVLVAYNFDAETKRYLRFSFGNKVPEALASGAAVLAYGPKELQTVEYLMQQNVAKVVTTPGRESLESAILELVNNRELRENLGKQGRKHAFEAFNLVCERKKMTESLKEITETWAPPRAFHARAAKAQFDECKFVWHALEARHSSGVMIDVGAHVGSSLIHFAKAGWHVYAFEPDLKNREKLLDRVQDKKNVRVFNNAVSDEVRNNVAFYSSEVSTGISGLTAFHESHVESARIDTTTLTAFAQEYDLAAVDFLKIDVEGHERDVLNGLDFTTIKPRAIVAEFEDGKTLSHGYSTSDLAGMLVEQGYSVFVSEWHPVETYGVQHSWKQLRRYPCQTAQDSWGNLIAFLEEPRAEVMRRAFRDSLQNINSPSKHGNNKLSEQGYGTHLQPARSKYVQGAEYLIKRHPVVAQFLRFVVWVLRTMRRRVFGIGGVSILVFAATILGMLLMPSYRLGWFIAGSVLSVGIGAFFVVGYIKFLMAERNKQLNQRIASLEETARQNSRRLVSTQAVMERVERRIISFEEMAVKRMDVNARAARSYSEKIMQKANALRAEQTKLKAKAKQFETKVETKSDGVIASMGASQALIKKMSNVNASLVRPHTRQLSETNLDRLLSFWSKALGTEYSKSQLGYLAHKICLAEDVAAGRLAAPVETMLLRLMASHSLVTDEVEILEIGTLFGIGAACLWKLRSPYNRHVSLTLLDPMEGYYEHGDLDPVTGISVSEMVLRDNLGVFGIPPEDWRLVKKLSTDPEGCEIVRDRQYDMIIIDGDHTVEGVARDFDLYGNSVKLNGILIFDDYDTEDWPDIKPYVDEMVRPLDQWEWIGGEFRTGIFRRVR